MPAELAARRAMRAGSAGTPRTPGAYAASMSGTDRRQPDELVELDASQHCARHTSHSATHQSPRRTQHSAPLLVDELDELARMQRAQRAVRDCVVPHNVIRAVVVAH
jgi:hypothetical protein